MQVEGFWQIADQGVVRPVMKAHLLDNQQEWKVVNLLIDTGADRTVLSGDILRDLGLSGTSAENNLAGVGGSVATVIVEAALRLTDTQGNRFVLKGKLAAFTDPDALDISVLGRDVLNLFALIVDRPQDSICLLHGDHNYRIEPTP